MTQTWIPKSLPRFTCNQLDQVVEYIKDFDDGNQADAAAEAIRILEEVREANRLLRQIAEGSMNEMAQAVDKIAELEDRLVKEAARRREAEAKSRLNRGPW